MNSTINHLKFFIVLFSSISISACFEDSYGRAPKVVKIGRQEWMLENLNVETFRNGDKIRQAKSEDEWYEAGKEGKSAWCYYNFDSTYSVYGRLYNWYAVADPRGIAPKGFRIPNDSDWIVLTEFLGDDENIGLKLKSKEEWPQGSEGNNISGWSGLPRGFVHKDATSKYLGEVGYWWSLTSSGSKVASYYALYSTSQNLGKRENWKSVGYSVRCIKE
ncbi:MAG: fibrobacter succinogenes major paralogous domain-containing protein [Flavobacteriales bacterium]|jgi:uncharacterized protein (TIGR02145 family)